MSRKSKKSDAELKNAYLGRVVKTVQAMDRQYEKLRKSFKAKKHGMTDAQKAKILEHMDDARTKFEVAISTQGVQKEKFQL